MGSAERVNGPESKPKSLALQKAFRALLKSCATRGITLRVTCGICGNVYVAVTGRGTYDAHSDARAFTASWRTPKCDSRGVFVPVELVMAAARDRAEGARNLAGEERARAADLIKRAAEMDAWAGELERVLVSMESAEKSGAGT